jgi:hypothetical protein
LFLGQTPVSSLTTNLRADRPRVPATAARAMLNSGEFASPDANAFASFALRRFRFSRSASAA